MPLHCCKPSKSPSTTTLRIRWKTLGETKRREMTCLSHTAGSWLAYRKHWHVRHYYSSVWGPAIKFRLAAKDRTLALLLNPCFGGVTLTERPSEPQQQWQRQHTAVSLLTHCPTRACDHRSPFQREANLSHEECYSDKRQRRNGQRTEIGWA